MTPNLTIEEWLDILFYDFWMPPQISMAEYEAQLNAVREAFA